MARTNGGSAGSLLFVAEKAFVAGCSGCLGVGMMVAIVFVLVSVVFQAQFVALIKTFPIPLFPGLAAVQIGVTPAPTAVQAVAVEIFISSENSANAPHVTQMKLPITQPLFVCVQGPQGTSAQITIRITFPNGQVANFGNAFSTDPSGQTVCIGPLTNLPNTAGVFRIDALAGTTIVGSTVLTVIP